MVKRYKPLVDKLFWIIWVPTWVLMAAVTVVSLLDVVGLVFIIPADALLLYFMVSPLFGYVELRDDTIFIKYGFIMKREIPYDKVRSVSKKRSFMAETMLSLKNSFDHVEIRYNAFDVTSVSVVGNDELINEINSRIKQGQGDLL